MRPVAAVVEFGSLAQVSLTEDVMKKPWPLSSVSEGWQLRIRAICRLIAPLSLLALFILAALGLIAGPLFLRLYRPDATLSQLLIHAAHYVGSDIFSVLYGAAVIIPLVIMFWILAVAIYDIRSQNRS